jgi:hypothetical protein
MDNTKYLTDTLLYFIPAILVLLAMLMLVKRFLDRDIRIRLIESKRSLNKESIPLKLQAYERLVLFLERISPNSLLVRTHQGGVSALQLHTDLIATIRAEFEHNLSQQIYISSPAWEAVKDSKEQLLKMINNALGEVGHNATGMQLSSRIFEQMLKEESFPLQHAINLLKNEARQLLG